MNPSYSYRVKQNAFFFAIVIGQVSYYAPQLGSKKKKE